MEKVYDNSGILFQNKDKEDPKHADFRGNATIDGVAYFMDAWKRQGAKGAYLTFSFKKKSGRFNTTPRGAPRDEDDNPFL